MYSLQSIKIHLFISIMAVCHQYVTTYDNSLKISVSTYLHIKIHLSTFFSRCFKIKNYFVIRISIIQLFEQVYTLSFYLICYKFSSVYILRFIILLKLISKILFHKIGSSHRFLQKFDFCYRHIYLYMNFIHLLQSVLLMYVGIRDKPVDIYFIII